MRRLLQAKLKFLSRLILKKYQPAIVAISGSIGKTSAKEAITLVLSSRLSARTSFKNYNNEIGLPLSIIGSHSPGSSIVGWMAVFLRAWRLYFIRDKSYPKILVLEMGIDRPGDMEYLCRLAPPQVGVMTAVSYSHLQYFGSLQNIKKEKQKLIEALSPQGLAILNYDDKLVMEMEDASPAPVVTFGLHEGADIKAQDISINFEADKAQAGINFKLARKGDLVPVKMPHVLAPSAVYSALTAAAVGLYFGLNLMEISQALASFRLPLGRMNLLPGVKGTFIIDDTYNSSPESCSAAIKTAVQLKLPGSAKRYAVLGDMLEIGSYSEKGHRQIGKEVFLSGIDYLISVGERARDFDRGAKSAGMSSDCIFHFDSSEEAGRFLQDRIKTGDLLLFKASQAVRLEKAVLELMAEPSRAKELLVRQGENWQ